MVVSKDTKIQAHGVYAVRVSFEGSRRRGKSDVEGMVEAFSNDPDFMPAKLQHVVWRADKGYAKIQVRNMTNRAKVLRKGTPIGHFQLERPELTTVDPLLLVDISRD